jgi:hypothetical protein
MMADDATSLKIASLRKSVKKEGAIWVVASKDSQYVKEIYVLMAGKKARLADVKVTSFPESQTAYKFVIPVSKR